MNSSASPAAPPAAPKESLAKRIRLFVNDNWAFLNSSVEQGAVEHINFKLIRRNIFILNDPQVIKYVLQENYQNYSKGPGYRVLAFLLGNGLLNSEGDFWKRQRRLAQPAFHRDKIQGLAQITADCTLRLLQQWKQREGETINFTQEMARLTIDIVSRALFGTSVTPQMIDEVWESVGILNEIASYRIRQPIILPLWLPLPYNIMGWKHVKRLDNIVYGIIEQRKANPQTDRHDLLQMLLDVQDEDTKEKMSVKQVRDEVMTIFLAGHETTVCAMSWLWYLLKQHPEEEQKLRNELLTELQGKAPNFEQAQRLKTNNNIINEAMRLYPPAYLVARTTKKADQFGEHKFGKGSTILVNIQGMHRHPHYWEKPTEFMPQRFDTFQMKGDNRFVYLPFGGGPRICIGNNFALLEMQVITALLSQKVEMELLSQEITPTPQITLKPGKGVIMHLKKVHLD